jgi:Ca2+-binding RTX toxin-like protein
VSSFELFNSLSQVSLSASSIAPLNPSLTLYSTNDLQDPPMGVTSLNRASNIDLASATTLTSAVIPQTFTVTSTADTVNPDDGVLTLREVIDLANQNLGADVINFDLLTGPQTITLTSGELKITDSLTIKGLGANQLTISGNNTSRIFNVDDGSDSTRIEVAIEDLTIARGRADGGSGGGIYNCETLTVSHSIFSSNSTSRGGGIYNTGTVTVSHSTFSGNSASGGGGIHNFFGTLTVSNSTFSGNSASDGGGIFNFGTATVSNSTLSNNSAIYFGGGISNYDTVTVHNSIVGGNQALVGGNEVWGYGRFTSNGYNLVGQNGNAGGFITTATDIVLQEGIETAIAPLANNSGTLTHALVVGSAAINAGNPAAVAATDQRGVFQVGRRDIGAYELVSNITVDTLVDEDDGNLSPGYISLREAIARVSSGGTVYFSNALSGATLQLTLGELLINKNLTIQGLGAEQLAISGNNTSRVFRVDDDIDRTQLQVVINGLTITAGRAMDGFAITDRGANQGAGIYSRESLTVSNSLLSSNSAYFGGGIYNDGNLTVNNSTFSGNSADYEGGGISNYGTLTVSNSTLSGNLANSAGGGIRNYRGTLTMTNSTLNSNSAQYEGGGIYNDSGILTITNSTLSGNSAATGGGISNTGTLTVSNSTLSGNSATTGGGIYNYATLRVGNSIISGNIALETSAELGNPGSFTSNGHNLVGQNGNVGGFITTATDLVLQGGIATAIAPLADNGGPTLTHALVAGSPALNAGNNALISVEVTTDQRDAGFSRILHGTVDIGAFESSLQPLPKLTTSDLTLTEGNNGSTIATFIVNLNAAATQPILVDYATVNGTATAGSDYIASSGTLVFKPGEISKTISIVINGDTAVELDETFFLTLYDSINAELAVNQVVARILNDDTVPITLLEGTNDHDTLVGDHYANTINGKAGDDLIQGLGGDDTISGGAGYDVVYSGDGNDIVNGNSGNDILYGGDGNDRINGGSEDDVIIGGAGTDTLTGGTGSDRFVYTSLADAGDIITDVSNGADILDLRELFKALNYTGAQPITDGYLRLVRVGGNTQVQIDAKDGAGFLTLVTLNGVTPDGFVIGQTLLI